MECTRQKGVRTGGGGAGGEEWPWASSGAAGAVGLVPQQAGDLAPSPRSAASFPPQRPSLPLLTSSFFLHGLQPAPAEASPSPRAPGVDGLS